MEPPRTVHYREYPSLNSSRSLLLFLELKLYVIVVPCVLGILFVSIIAVAAVVMCRRRRFSSTRNGAPVVQMSLLNEDESVSNTQMTDIGPHSEASLPVYRPTTQAIKR